ncbi:MAG: hypothetical protein JWO67_3226 [Streptosporangiaceae bacterium]|jgi:hypothetical protein|nr:hypothetical protein [Streptosporangiaceae bacterium]
MSEGQQAWDVLAGAGFLHALRDAHEAATRIVFGRLSRSAGFKERSFGYTSFDVLESQLDRVFHVGAGGQAAPGDPLLGAVARDNLNGSPGWRYGDYRVLLKRYDFGAVESIRWDQASPTKQAVSKQEFAEDPQLALDLGDQDLPPATGASTTITLVLAHSASSEPLELELFLGQPRFNADGGSPWWWRRALTREALGADPRRGGLEPAMPIWSEDEADVPLRLRARQAGTSSDVAR